MGEIEMVSQFKIKLRLVGPITRSTMNEIPDDSPECLINDALHWIWSWQLQLARYCESINNELLRFGDGDPRSFSRTSFDEHVLMVAGGQVVRSVIRARSCLPTLVIPRGTTTILKELRDIYEHWEQHRAPFRNEAPMVRSGKKFSEKNPTGKPWEVIFEKDDIILAHVLSTNLVFQQLHVLEKQLCTELAKIRHNTNQRKTRGCP
jgi:hypothetical protein